MCVTNVYIDRYPDGREVEFRQTNFCQYGRPGQPCNMLSTLENPARNIQFGEPTTEHILTSYQKSRPSRSSRTTPPPDDSDDDRWSGQATGASSEEGSNDEARKTRAGTSKRPGQQHRRPGILPLNLTERPTRQHRKERVVIVDRPPIPVQPPPPTSYLQPQGAYPSQDHFIPDAHGNKINSQDPGEIENMRRMEERDRALRAQRAEREEEALKQRFRERMMPKRRFSTGPGYRRHRVLYDDGIYRWGETNDDSPLNADSGGDPDSFDLEESLHLDTGTASGNNPKDGKVRNFKDLERNGPVPPIVQRKRASQEGGSPRPDDSLREQESRDGKSSSAARGEPVLGHDHEQREQTIGKSSSIDGGNRRKVAKALLAISNRLGTAVHDQFDDSEFKHGKADHFPEIPGEEQQNSALNQIKDRYNQSWDADGNVTPSLRRQHSRGSFTGSVNSELSIEGISTSRSASPPLPPPPPPPPLNIPPSRARRQLAARLALHSKQKPELSTENGDKADKDEHRKNLNPFIMEEHDDFDSEDNDRDFSIGDLDVEDDGKGLVGEEGKPRRPVETSDVEYGLASTPQSSEINTATQSTEKRIRSENTSRKGKKKASPLGWESGLHRIGENDSSKPTLATKDGPEFYYTPTIPADVSPGQSPSPDSPIRTSSSENFPRSISPSPAVPASDSAPPRSKRIFTEDTFTVEEFNERDYEYWDEGFIKPHQYIDAESDREDSVKSAGSNGPNVDIFEDDEERLAWLEAKRAERWRKRRFFGSLRKRTLSESSGLDGSSTHEEDLHPVTFGGANEADSSARRLRRKTQGQSTSLIMDDPPPDFEYATFPADDDEDMEDEEGFMGIQYLFPDGPTMETESRLVARPNNRGGMSRSSSIESLQSLVDSIFSIASLSSASTVPATNNAFQRVLVILRSDRVLKALYEELTAKTSAGKFNRNFGTLLKRFSVDLEKEATCWNEQRTAQFIRSRARKIAQCVGNSVYSQTPQTITIEKNKDRAESSEDSDLEEEPDEFQELEKFITNSNAFQTLRESIRGFLGLEPAPPTLQDVVREHGTGKLLAELPFTENGYDSLTDETIYPVQDTSQYRQSTWFSTNFTQKFRNMQLSEPPIPDGMSRVKWKCACGEILYDDYHELKPGAAKRMEDFLRRSSYKSHADNSKSVAERISSIGIGLKGAFASLRDKIQYLKTSSSPGLVSTELRYYSETRTTRIPAHSSGEVFYLLLCHNDGVGAEIVKLRQPDICDINNDQKLFNFLHEEYKTLRKRWWTWISLWTLQSIKFVRFELYENELVDVKKLDEVPPPTKDNEYRHGPPNPPELNPPLGSNLLMHLFKHPELAGTRKHCLKKIPRKLRNRLAVLDEEDDAIGWGLQFIEGWSKKRLMYMTALTFGLSSFVVMILVSILGHDIQNAAAIASFMLSFVTIGIATAQAALHMT